MMFSEIKAEYARLRQDNRRIKTVNELLPVCDFKVVKATDELQSSNVQAQKQLITLAQRKFPTVSNEVKNLSKDEFDAWVRLLRCYPAFLKGKEKAVIGVFSTFVPEKSEDLAYLSAMLPIVQNPRIEKAIEAEKCCTLEFWRARVAQVQNSCRLENSAAEEA